MGQEAKTKEALHNLSLTQSYIEAFLDQSLNHIGSPLLDTTANHSEAIVKQYGH
jgi:hypothetical protein